MANTGEEYSYDQAYAIWKLSQMTEEEKAASLRGTQLNLQT
jgi:hypothetical protein